jgi:hypothetical protein
MLFIKSVRENGTMDTGKATFFGLRELYKFFVPIAHRPSKWSMHMSISNASNAV